jgi:hypothetical protein
VVQLIYQQFQDYYKGTIDSTRTNDGLLSRRDKSFQPLDKKAVGLNNLDNTADIDKPVSNAISNVLLLKEDVNKSTDGTLLSNSDVKYPTVKATKTYVDSAIVNGVLDVSVTEKGKIKLAGDIGNG